MLQVKHHLITHCSRTSTKVCHTLAVSNNTLAGFFASKKRSASRHLALLLLQLLEFGAKRILGGVWHGCTWHLLKGSHFRSNPQSNCVASVFSKTNKKITVAARKMRVAEIELVLRTTFCYGSFPLNPLVASGLLLLFSCLKSVVLALLFLPEKVK